MTLDVEPGAGDRPGRHHALGWRLPLPGYHPRGAATGTSAESAPQPAPASPTTGVEARDAGVRSWTRGLGGVGRDLRLMLSPTGARWAITEAAWISAHFAIYPLGVVAERRANPDRYHLQGLDPVQRGLVEGDVEAAGTPILLVHGMADNRAIFTVLKRRLRRRGFGRVVTLNYSPATNDIRQAARHLAAEVEALVAETGFERLHVVGHSLGGLIARYYVQRLGGDERVHTLVTLGTPHRGSLLAHLLTVNLCRQLRPGSDLMTELEEPAPGCRTRFVAYWSDLDQVILPHHHARLEHRDLSVRNVVVHGLGHTSLPHDREVVREISTLLGHLDSDGTTLTAGVTPLLETPPAAPSRRRRSGRRSHPV